MEPRWSVPRKSTRIFTSGLSLPQQSHAAINLSYSHRVNKGSETKDAKQNILTASIRFATLWTLSGCW